MCFEIELWVDGWLLVKVIVVVVVVLVVIGVGVVYKI